MPYNLIDEYIESRGWSNKHLQVCKRCVMDSSESFTTFNSEGICSNCLDYDLMAPTRLKHTASSTGELEQLVDKVKLRGKNKEYDCIVGISGGADSSYLVFKAKQLGLRPLAVHLDNGWNSELAVHNIQSLLTKLSIDLHTVVLDWDEFRSLQLAFLKSSTPDVEVPTDHAIWACLMEMAKKFGVSFILSGANYATESIPMHSWSYGHADWHYIKNINRKFGTKDLASFPHYSLTKLGWNLGVRGIKFISLLNYLQYDKASAITELESAFGWRKYIDKHGESTYTRFIQTILLPIKFGIDKRKAHLSAEILSGSGKMSRERALGILNECPFDIHSLTEDINFVLKKLELSESAFNEILNAPTKSFLGYPNRYDFILKLKKVLHYLRRLGLFPL